MTLLHLPRPIRFVTDGLREAVEQELAHLRPRRALLVTTPRMTARPPFAAVADAARAANVELSVWIHVPAEPSPADLEASLGFAREVEPDLVAALGGGSAIDVAKLTALLLINPPPLDRYLGVGNVPRPGVPTLLMPTTAGSGSEVSQDAVLTDRDVGTKMAVKDPNIVATVAVVDPAATISCPPELTATCGLDALTHALEAYTARASNPVSDLFARAAVELLWRHLPRAFEDGTDLEARSGASLGALLAGMAFTTTGTAAVHACGYPLSGLYGLAHGAANALVLPAVVAFNQEACPKYEALRRALDVDDLPEALRAFVAGLGLRTRLRDAGVQREAIARLTEIASADARHLEANPRPIGRPELERIFTEIW
jgi:alcohol dehydrogenase class IV